MISFIISIYKISNFLYFFLRILGKGKISEIKVRIVWGAINNIKVKIERTLDQDSTIFTFILFIVPQTILTLISEIFPFPRIRIKKYKKLEILIEINFEKLIEFLEILQ